MLQIRPSEERGHVVNEWLDSHHSFSFGDYHDPEHMGVSVLRVINEDHIAPGRGFGTHPHNDMEIVTYLLSGELEHRDSMGNGSVIRPGDIQRMSAGSGVTHSEVNPSASQEAHLLQIWFLPNRRGVEPGYAQRTLAEGEREGRLALLISPDGREGSVAAHTGALMYATILQPGQSVSHEFEGQRVAYVQVARGVVELDGARLQAGDAAMVSEVPSFVIQAIEPAEVLLFDLPAEA